MIQDYITKKLLISYIKGQRTNISFLEMMKLIGMVEQGIIQHEDDARRKISKIINKKFGSIGEMTYLCINK